MNGTEIRVGTFIKKKATAFHEGMGKRYVKPFRIYAVDAEDVYLQDAYKGVFIYKKEELLTQFEPMGSKEMPWDIHCVIKTDGEGYLNFHTHGMYWFNHLDFQVVLPIQPAIIEYTLNAMAYYVREGRKFKDGDMVYDLYEGSPAKLMEVEELDRKVLRILIPDESGRFPDEEGCNAAFQKQIQPGLYE